jgi:hypothetical protein
MDINSNTYILFASKLYDKPNAIWDEFVEDLKLLQSIKRLINRYRLSGKFNEKMILNNLVIFYNVFGPEGTRLLFYKVGSDNWELLKPFLIFLGYLPDVIESINGQDILTKDIPLNTDIMNSLRQL